MGFFGGIGNAIKKVGGGAAGALGMGGHGAPPPSSSGSAVGQALPDAVANENQRTFMGAGMGEAQAIRASRAPRNQWRMPLPSNGFGRVGGAMASGASGAFQPRGMGAAMGQIGQQVGAMDPNNPSAGMAAKVGQAGSLPPGMMKPPMADDGMGEARMQAPGMPRAMGPGESIYPPGAWEDHKPMSGGFEQAGGAAGGEAGSIPLQGGDPYSSNRPPGVAGSRGGGLMNELMKRQKTGGDRGRAMGAPSMELQ